MNPTEQFLASLNGPQKETLEKLKRLVPMAHHVDIQLRINGRDEAYEADWLKDLLKLV